MTDSITDYAQWIGRKEITDDDLGLSPTLAAAATRKCTAAVVALVLLSSQGTPIAARY